MTKQVPLALFALTIALGPVAQAQQQPSAPTAAPAVGSPPAAAPAAASPPTAAPPPPAIAAPPPAATPAPPPSEARIAPHRWDVDRVRCSDLLRASDEDRASAAMFYYGYLAAKAGIHIIDTSRISGNIAKVVQLCKARPGLTVPQAFREALRPRRRG